MATLAQKWKEEGRIEGLEQGLEQGLNAQRQTLLRLLNWRFALTEVQQATYSQQLTQIHDLAILTHLLDDLLAAQTVTAFAQKLQTALATASKSD